MQSVTTITRKGQITIPIKFRQGLDLEIGRKVLFDYSPYQEDALVLKPVPDFVSLKGTFKSKKKYNKKTARRTFIKDIISNKV